jgi:uncharacterized protein YciW
LSGSGFFSLGAVPEQPVTYVFQEFSVGREQIRQERNQQRLESEDQQDTTQYYRLYVALAVSDDKKVQEP